MDPAFMFHDLDLPTNLSWRASTWLSHQNLPMKESLYQNALHRHHDGKVPNVDKPSERFASGFIFGSKH